MTINPNPQSPRILIVGGDAPMRQSLCMQLRGCDFRAEEADRGAAALDAVRRKSADLLLLDLDLPDIDGLQVIRRIRYARSNVPIVVLSDRDGDQTRVAALDMGADDYMRRPFSFDDLLVRIRALRRHRLNPAADGNVLAVGDLLINTAGRNVAIRGKFIHLSPREFELLHLLAVHAGTVLTHRFILRQIWAGETELQYLRIYIRALRQKIEANPDRPSVIVTVQGVGYLLRGGSKGNPPALGPVSEATS